MSEPDSADARNLTGVWHGLYTYPSGGPSVPFIATLIEAASTLTGTIREDGPSESGKLFATVAGDRHDNAVNFVKAYQSSNPSYGIVLYAGTLNAEATEIEGTWTVPRNWSGSFLMIRSGSATHGITRKVSITAQVRVESGRVAGSG